MVLNNKHTLSLASLLRLHTAHWQKGIDSKSRLVHGHFPDQPAWSHSWKITAPWVSPRQDWTCLPSEPASVAINSPIFLDETVCLIVRHIVYGHVCSCVDWGKHLCLKWWATSLLSLWTQRAAAGRRWTNCGDAVKPWGWNSALQEGEIAYLVQPKVIKNSVWGSSAATGMLISSIAWRMDNKAFSLGLDQYNGLLILSTVLSLSQVYQYQHFFNMCQY